MKKKVVAIIQARMGSSRLPGKVLMTIEGEPILGHVVRRLNKAREIDEVVVATTRNPIDGPIVDLCVKNQISVFRGDEEDVLDRFYGASKKFMADPIVRITADCPLIDPEVVDKVINAYIYSNHDYVANNLRYTYPDGLDVEVFSFKALETAWKEAFLPAEREHVTPYLHSSGKFKVLNVENEVDLSLRKLRFTIDEPSDLEFIRSIYRSVNGTKEIFTLKEILEFLDENPQMLEINAGIIRNEGYYKSLMDEPAMPPQHRKLNKSYELKKRALRVIPSCSQTFSKGPTQYVQGVAPVFLLRGKGSHVWDVDGNEYIDYPMALGPVILGHNYQAVTDAVVNQIREGVSFSLPHPLEIEVAEMLVEAIPCAEMARFGKNGSDATSGAIRVARAFTGREVIACCGYHGWQDWYIGTTTRNRGVPKAFQELTVTFEYNNIESLQALFSQYPGKIAAVIMEPIGVEQPKDRFLKDVLDLTHKEGALLIFDEVITGFRLSLGGAQQYLGVIPDLACFGKAMANGYPISAVVGRREVMELFDEVFFSFTFGGDAVSLAATKATIKEIIDKNVIGHLWEQGKKLKDGYNVLALETGLSHVTTCLGTPPRTVITFKEENGAESLEKKSLFQQECLKRGLLFSGGQNICFDHANADVEHTLRVYRTAMEILADAIQKGKCIEKLEGDLIQPVFRKA